MRWAWIVGGLHGFAGSAILFGSLHPLREILSPEALNLAQLGSALEIGQAVTLLVLARAQVQIAAGGAIMLIGWIVLIFSTPKAAT
jgi:hypothetical protein